LSTAYLAWLSVCLIWGTTYLGIAVALESIPPALVGGIRWTVAGLLLAFVLHVRGESLPAPSKWGGFALLGLLLIGFGNGAVIFAAQSLALLVHQSGVCRRAQLAGAGRALGMRIAASTLVLVGVEVMKWMGTRPGAERAAARPAA
jgi:drug/metabolite transporter (DMT)-like permease